MFRRFFHWVASLFARGDSYDLYRPAERLLYQYFDGKGLVRADPMVLYKRMMERGPELAVDIQVSQSPSKSAGKAYSDMVEKVRQIFSLAPYEAGGLTELEAVELLYHFMTYTGMLKKNSSPSPTSAEATSAVCEPSSAENPATPPSSDSGSTADAPSSAPPAPSSSEPA